jgi:capsular polysaccharide biosynthesis protein
MEINEAFRRIVVGHRWLLMTCALLPIVAVAAVLTFSPVRYIASARVQASSADVGTDIQADSVVNRVRGIATSPAVVGEAMRKAGVHGRSARDVGTHDITVTELGSSPVLDLSVSDANPRVAQDLTNSLARIVVDALGGQQDARKRQLASQVRSQQQQLYQQRKSLLTSLAHSGSAARIASLSAQLSTVDQQLADIASTLRQLALPDATDGSAMFISPAQEALSAKPNVVTDFALALMAGLVAGLLVSTLARDLGVPFLGDIAVSPGAGADARVSQPTESLVALTGAAARCRAETIVVVGCGEHAGAEATMLAVSRSLRDAFAATPAQNGYSGSGLSAHQPWQTSPPRSEAPEAERAQPVSLLETEDRMSAAPPTVVDVRALTTSWGTGQVRGGRHALVVLASAPLPQRDIDRVVSLSSATGWPVLGVLALTVREDERPTSHPRQAPDVPADRGERAGDQA